MAETCAIEGCSRPISARGWCTLHYSRWYRHGDPLANHRLRRRPFEDFFKRGAKDECWEWLGMRTSKGYGAVYMGRTDDGRDQTRTASRIAWERANRPLHPGEIIMHLCDNPPCVNPAHLRAGSYSDNTQDAYDKGRQVGFQPGEAHPNSRLTGADIRAIRELAPSTSQTVLAAQFGVSQGCISDIITRRCWTHVR